MDKTEKFEFICCFNVAKNHVLFINNHFKIILGRSPVFEFFNDSQPAAISCEIWTR